MRMTGNYTLGDWMRTRRDVRGATQTQLANYLETRQPNISAIESGSEPPGPCLLTRIEAALALPPGEILAAKRDHMQTIAEDCGIRNLRVFGSVARHEDHIGSDIDFLADCEANLMLAASHFEQQAEALLTVPVDIVFDQELNPSRPKTSVVYEQAAAL